MTLPLRAVYPYLVLVPLLLGAKEGKGCNCGGKPDGDPVVVDTDVPDDVPVEVALQVVSLDPSVGDSNRAFEARLYGAGFDAGAAVHIGAIQAANVARRDENTLTLTVPGLAAGVYDVVVVNPGGERATLRRGLSVREPVVTGTCDFVRVPFGFDKDALSDESRRELDAKAPCLLQKQRLTVEGHTDERGTISYNLGLGDRRAWAVVRHLQGLGVPGSRIERISYGEERPAVQGHSESAWAQNRRVDVHAK